MSGRTAKAHTRECSDSRIGDVPATGREIAPIGGRCQACKTHRLYRLNLSRAAQRADNRWTCGQMTPASEESTSVKLSAYVWAQGPLAGKSDRRRDVSERLGNQPRMTVPRALLIGRY